jgi:phospholipid/cholesterol/gamma-HCH transport system substrate-binding protein
MTMKRSLELAKMNVRVGIMAVAGFAILVWVLFFPVRGASFFSDKITVTGYYERVDGLRRNAPVYYRGTEVGSIKAVRIVPERPEAPMEVVISVEKHILPLLPKTTVMHIVALGLLGDVFVDLESSTRTEGQPMLADGDVLPTKPYDSVLAGMNGLTDKVKVTLDRVNSILANANDPHSSIGRLLHEDELYKELVAAVRELKTTAARIAEIEKTVNTKLMDPGTKKSVDSAVASAQRVLDRADKLTAQAANVRWHLSLGLDKYEGSLYGAQAGLTIIPNNDRFYYGGLSYFNQSLTFTAVDTLAGGYAGYDAFLAWRILGSPIFFRGGLKRTSVDAGLDIRVGDMVASIPVEINADVYRFGNAVSQLDLGASIAFLKAFKLTGGVEDVLNTPRYRAGLTLIYDDEDLTSILVKSKM